MSKWLDLNLAAIGNTQRRFSLLWKYILMQGLDVRFRSHVLGNEARRPKIERLACAPQSGSI